jgi:hypothetical protein
MKPSRTGGFPQRGQTQRCSLKPRRLHNPAFRPGFLVYKTASRRRCPLDAVTRAVRASQSATAPGHPSDRRQLEPGKISRKGGRRPSRVTRSALAGDLCPASHWSAGTMAALAARAPGADRCSAPVRRAAGNNSAADAAVPDRAKERQAAPRRVTIPRNARPVTGRSCAAPESAPTPRGAYSGAAARRVRRASRALEKR